MADDRHYVPGSFYRLDDRTGFKRRAERTLWEWDGLIVDRTVWEPRQPQDFVRGVRDVQSVPQPRPRQTDMFVIVGTWVTAFSPRLTNPIEVKTTQGFNVGDQVVIPLDEGDVYYPFIAALTSTTMTLAPPIPFNVGGGIDQGTYFGVENTVVLWRPGNGGYGPPNGFYSNGGELSMYARNGWPEGDGAPGAFYSNGLEVSVTAGLAYNPARGFLYYGGVSPASLLALDGSYLPDVRPPVGTLILYKNGNSVAIA